MSEAHRTTEWNRARTIAKPRLLAEINAGEGWCIDGKHPIHPGEKWDVSHIVSVATMQAAGAPLNEIHDQANLAASHIKCNRSAGGRAGAKVSNARRTKKEFPQW